MHLPLDTESEFCHLLGNFINIICTRCIFPSFLVPHLHFVNNTGKNNILLETGIFTKLCRNKNSSLTIGFYAFGV